MTVMDPNWLVDDYIDGLARAAQSLPAERREELLADVRSHVAESGATTEAEVRNVLERLGSAEEILAAYEDAPSTPPRAEPRLRFQEYAALVLLPLGGFLFIVGWLVGVALLWASNRWRTGEKWLGTLFPPFGYLSFAIAGLLPGQTCGTATDASGGVTESCTGFALPIWIGIPLFAILVIAPIVTVALLASRAAPNRA
jgi:hypothetical protein